MAPEAPFNGPDERPDDLGLAMWEGGPEMPVPEETGVKLPPPLARRRHAEVTWPTALTRWDPWWDGTSMSERLGLGVADGESRWIGVRRHQAILAIAGLGLVGEWVTQVHRVLIELVLGAALFSCAAPTNDGLTVGERVRIAIEFGVRSRWTSIRATIHHDVVTIVAHGDATTRGFELQHRGRLDLSGRDQQNALALEQFADALGASDDTQHFSLHVRSSPNGVATLLAVPADVSAPSGWMEKSTLAMDAVSACGDENAGWLLERWTYVRDVAGVTACCACATSPPCRRSRAPRATAVRVADVGRRGARRCGRRRAGKSTRRSGRPSCRE